MNPHHIFITGGSGYVGRPLIEQLITRMVVGEQRPGATDFDGQVAGK